MLISRREQKLAEACMRFPVRFVLTSVVLAVGCGSGGGCPADSERKGACGFCDSDCACEEGLSCINGICTPQEKGGEGSACKCSASCKAGLVCKSSICQAGRSEAGVSILSFAATPAWGDAPLLSSFEWEVEVGAGGHATCSLDLDGDGKIDKVVKDCSGPGSTDRTFAEPGRYKPCLHVEDEAGNQAMSCVLVFANEIEFADEVLFPNQWGAFVKAGMEEEGQGEGEIPDRWEAWEGGILTLQLDPGQEHPEVTEGGILWLTEPPLLVRVQSVLEDGPDLLRLEVTPAQLNEAVRNCRFGAAFVPGEVLETDAAALRAYVEMDDGRILPLESTKQPLVVKGEGSVGAEYEWEGLTLKSDQGADLFTAKITMAAGFKVKELYIDIGWFEVNEFTLDMGLESSVDITAEFLSKLDVLKIKKVIAEVPVGVIPIGPVVLTVNAKPVLSIKGQLGLKAAVSTGTSVYGGVAVSYKGGDVDIAPKLDIKPVTELLQPDVSVDAFVELKTAFSPGIAVKLLGLIGPYVYPYGYVKLNANVNLFPDKELCLNGSAGIEGEAGLTAGFFGLDADIGVSVEVTAWKFLEDQCTPLAEILGTVCGNGECELAETACGCPDDCLPACGDGCCADGEECDCPDDCEPTCGNAECDCGESFETCPQDCLPEADCGDGLCNQGETCQICALDCGDCCGDGQCDADLYEDCKSCPDDCGGCCGDGECRLEDGEDCLTCFKDCGACAPCGDGQCVAGESCAGCPEDCGNCCGNGGCDKGFGEDCYSCPGDCSCECPANACEDAGKGVGTVCTGGTLYQCSTAGDGCFGATFLESCQCDAAGKSCLPAGCPGGCGQDATCVASQCEPCTGTLHNCNGSDGDGCEADFQSSTQHCGKCNQPCTGGQYCKSGQCEVLDPILVVEPGKLDFQEVPMGEPATLVATVTNGVGEDVTIGCTVTGDASAFDVPCPSAIAEGGSKAMSVKFLAPSGQTTKSYGAQVKLSWSSAGDSGTAVLDLAGKSMAQDLYLVGQPPEVDFGPVKLNDSAEEWVTIALKGNGSTLVSNVYLTSSSGFSLSETCSNKQLSTTAVNSCQAKVTFAPTSLKSYSSKLVVESSSAGQVEVPLSGDGDSSCTSECSAGEATCSGESSLKTCKKDSQTGCYVYSMTSCASGTVCSVNQCVACGAEGQKCCAGSKCNSGLTCNIGAGNVCKSSDPCASMQWNAGVKATSTQPGVVDLSWNPVDAQWKDCFTKYVILRMAAGGGCPPPGGESTTCTKDTITACKAGDVMGQTTFSDTNVQSGKLYFYGLYLKKSNGTLSGCNFATVTAK
jgi:hypothetical protein